MTDGDEKTFICLYVCMYVCMCVYCKLKVMEGDESPPAIYSSHFLVKFIH
jgi:hypothetical protein